MASSTKQPTSDVAASKATKAKSKDKPAEELSASEVLQRRMGLGKLIADRLASKLTEEDQQAFTKAHAEQNFEEYSRLVAKLQFKPATEKAEPATGGEGGTDGTVVDPDKSEAELIREHMAANPEANNQEVIAAFEAKGVEISSSQVSAAKRQLRDSD